jgi:hypothetical protein
MVDFPARRAHRRSTRACHGSGVMLACSARHTGSRAQARSVASSAMAIRAVQAQPLRGHGGACLGHSPNAASSRPGW